MPIFPQSLRINREQMSTENVTTTSTNTNLRRLRVIHADQAAEKAKVDSGDDALNRVTMTIPQ